MLCDVTYYALSGTLHICVPHAVPTCFLLPQPEACLSVNFYLPKVNIIIDVCMYTCIQVIINNLAPIEIQHGVQNLELNNGQLQCFVECPGSISFRHPRPLAEVEMSFSAVLTCIWAIMRIRRAPSYVTLYYTALAKKPKTF